MSWYNTLKIPKNQEGLKRHLRSLKLYFALIFCKTPLIREDFSKITAPPLDRNLLKLDLCCYVGNASECGILSN